MLRAPRLLRSCSIRPGQILVDGAVEFSGEASDFGGFAQAAYKHLQVEYSKFHKMDNLSKLGFLAAEYLLSGTALLAQSATDRAGIVVSNATSSTDTDLRYNAQVQQQVASPALFVYTLPNIVLGEICIRHGMKGENTLFVSENYDAAAQVSYIRQLLADDVLETCIGGWLDYFGTDYRAFLYLVGPGDASAASDFTAANVQTLFTI